MKQTDALINTHATYFDNT